MSDQISKVDVLNENPLVTFALFAYNQEQYIREAVEGALSQTYSPLQIILSDDNSSDRTFEIMQEIASQYRGPHQIDLNKNKFNQGIGGHINMLMSLTKGDFVVIAAGDDISLPERTRILVEKWIKLGSGALSLHSSVLQMDSNGRDLGIKKPAKKFNGFRPGAIIGASHGWSKKLIDTFGELEANVKNEDQAIGFRSYLLDGVHYIDSPLVRYRTGGVSDSKNLPDGQAFLHYEQQRWNRYLVLWKQMNADLEKITFDNSKLKDQLQIKMSEFTLLRDISLASKPLQVLWNNRFGVNFFILKNAIKLLYPGLYVRIQPLLNKLRRVIG